MKRAVQYFTPEYLAHCREMSPADIVEFLESFRELHGARAASGSESSKSKLISIKIPEDLLGTFRRKAELQGVPYQTQIKLLMKQWLLGE